MDQPDAGSGVRELHRDLARKYRIHASKLVTYWRSFDKEQRVKAMRAGAADGVVLKHRNDTSLGVVCHVVPEWNLRDITQPDSDFLLDLMRYRATTPLMQQYGDDHPLNAPGGDYGHIVQSVRNRTLRHVDEGRHSNSFALFMSDEEYGKFYDVPPSEKSEEILAYFTRLMGTGLCVTRTVGDFILMRQTNLLQSLNIIIEDILDIGSTTRSHKPRPPKNTDAATAAMAKLAIQAQPVKLSLPDLLELARDQRAAVEEYLSLLSTEPVVLAYAANIAFFSRPELIPDEKGRTLPVHTDRFISAAVFEAIHSGIRAAAIWTYICKLLEKLQTTTDKVYRAIILQEISNTCHLEYSRTQSLLKRYVQTGTGSKYFKRASNVFDNGNARVTLKVKPEELTRADPQVHYLLRLCQADTTAPKAVEWMDKLDKLHTAHPDEREKLNEREFNSICDHAVIVALFRDLAPGVSMPPLSRKKGQLFVSRAKLLEAELNTIRDQIDLTDFVVPIDNLMEPGVAENALKALEKAIVEKTGTKMGFLYQDMIDDCFSDLEKQYQQIKAKVETKDKAESVEFLAGNNQSLEVRTEQRRQKEKTRPAHSSVFDIVSEPPKAADKDADTTTKQQQTFKVKRVTADVFSTLFAKSEARGTVSWALFEAAMADLGFSVLPKFGSVYTFLPPESMEIKKPLTVHRPHKANIEGWLLLILARRLKRVYGWSEHTFEVAE